MGGHGDAATHWSTINLRVGEGPVSLGNFRSRSHGKEEILIALIAAIYGAPGVYQHWAGYLECIILFLQKNLRLRGVAQGYMCGPGRKQAQGTLPTQHTASHVHEGTVQNSGGSLRPQMVVGPREQRQLGLP